MKAKKQRISGLSINTFYYKLLQELVDSKKERK